MASRPPTPLGSSVGAFIYRLFVAIVELMIVRGKPRRMLEAEVIALRHQVSVVQRTSTRPELTDADRGVIAGLACPLLGGSVTDSSSPPTRCSPGTGGWPRPDGCTRQRRPGRPRTVRDREQLIVRLAPSTVWAIRKRHGIDPAPRRTGPTGTQFLTAQARGIIACDAFVVDTVGLRQLHVLFFIEHATRQGHLACITGRLTGGWCTQAARNLNMTLNVDRFRLLIRDNATVFAAAFDEIFTTNRLDVIRTPPGAPRANATAEHFVRTARTELLDHTLI